MISSDPDLGRLAKHTATLNAERGADAATPESAITDGLEQAVSTVGKVAGGFNPSLKDRGAIPWETNVGGGMALSNLSPLRDVPGGILAGLAKYFTLAWDWLMGGDAGSGEAATSEGNGDSSGASGNTAEGVGPQEMGAAHAVDMPEFINYGGKLMASDPVDVPMERLGELVPSETPSAGRDAPAEGVSL